MPTPQLRTHFDGLSATQKRQFIEQLKAKPNKSPEHVRFINECTQKYNAEVSGGSRRTPAIGSVETGRKTVIMRSTKKISILVVLWLTVIAAGVYITSAFVRVYSLYSSNPFARLFTDNSAVFFLCAILIVLMIMLVCIAVSYSKSYVCVCNDGVYGVAGKTFFISTQPFDVSYNQITSVSKSSIYWLTGTGNLKIECGPHKYTCLVNEPDKIIKLIKSRTS
jgi:hypothetical protein